MTCRTRWSLLVISLCLGSRLALALDPKDVPANAPTDKIMAGPEEVEQMANWADRAFGTDRPAVLRMWSPSQDDHRGSLLSSALPFSFIYGGKPSAELLKGWIFTVRGSQGVPEGSRHDVAWTDPRSGLRVSAEVLAYKRYPAVDWVLRFENTGKQDTPILEDIQALDVTLATRDAQRTAVLHHLAGDDASQRSFLPLESPLAAGGTIRLAAFGGRSSNGAGGGPSRSSISSTQAAGYLRPSAGPASGRPRSSVGRTA